jgi:hypothetical protein
VDRIYQPAQQPTPSPEALAEANQLLRLAAALRGLAANDAEQAGDETLAAKHWAHAEQNLAATA